MNVAGSVYFDRTQHGKKQKLQLPRLKPVTRRRMREKRAPEDFALWKAAKHGEPAWDSPWGPGRPGWHIECSTMTR